MNILAIKGLVVKTTHGHLQPQCNLTAQHTLALLRTAFGYTRRLLITGFQNPSSAVSISLANFVMVACPPLLTAKTSILYVV
ncbi:hypothetical protein EVAR_33576_1 [Eumeta japonica]|uniref:Uncharacterized protein n=1 Tax=Eumeta variegata TaxID=151549 RepID=A0A4C1VM15_EUMVA|nr:hypothetical protein EVAR_33576_1 [Eumeta japonica]